MSNFRTTTDCKQAVLKRCGELTDGTSSYDADALTYMQSVYRALLAGGNEFSVDCGEPWIWAQASTPMVLQLRAPITAGSVTLTEGSAAGVFSSAPSESLTGWFLKLESVSDFYQITSHISGQVDFTIDQPFIQVTTTSVYKAIKTDYVLPSPVCRLCAPMVVYQDTVSSVGDPERGQVYEIDANTMIRNYPRMLIQQSVPNKYAVIGQTSSDQLTVRFNSYPLEDCRLEVPYIAVAADLVDDGVSAPLIPFGFREVLVHGAAYYLMLDKVDNRSDTEANLAKSKILALINHNRKSLSLSGSSFGRLIPRASGMFRRWGRSGV